MIGCEVMDMKKRISIIAIIVILILSLTLTSCNNKNTESPNESEAGENLEEENSENEETSTEEAANTANENASTPNETEGNGITEAEAVEQKERADKMKAEYVKALRTIYMDSLEPDGTELVVGEGAGNNFEDNTFAVFDVNGDGMQELIFRYDQTYMAAQHESIYYYNTFIDEMTKILSYSPYNEYYTGGYIKCNASHNHSLCLDFWPYTLMIYSEGAGEYVYEASVTAWNKADFEKDYNDVPFPDDYDKDGDGIVYYIYERGWEDEGEPEPVDYDVLEAWESNNIGKETPLRMDFFKMTEYNIDKFENSSGYATFVDESEYTKYEFGDMHYYLPNEFVEKVEIKEDEDGITFYHKATKEMGEKVYGLKDGYGRIGALMEFSDWDYFDLPNYRYIGASDTHQYVMNLPSDVQMVIPEHYEMAKENGFEVTEEELTEIMDDYRSAYEMAKDLHAVFAMG